MEEKKLRFEFDGITYEYPVSYFEIASELFDYNIKDIRKEKVESSPQDIVNIIYVLIKNEVINLDEYEDVLKEMFEEQAYIEFLEYKHDN